jgi:hypothetical protein
MINNEHQQIKEKFSDLPSCSTERNPTSRKVALFPKSGKIEQKFKKSPKFTSFCTSLA